MVTYSDDGQAVNHLDDLAARIRTEHDGVHAAVRNGLEHALAAGDLLMMQAKKQLKHGEWGGAGSRSTANSRNERHSATSSL
jgi:hypothetical protein